MIGGHINAECNQNAIILLGYSSSIRSTSLKYLGEHFNYGNNEIQIDTFLVTVRNTMPIDEIATIAKTENPALTMPTDTIQVPLHNFKI